MPTTYNPDPNDSAESVTLPVDGEGATTGSITASIITIAARLKRLASSTTSTLVSSLLRWDISPTDTSTTDPAVRIVAPGVSAIIASSTTAARVGSFSNGGNGPGVYANSSSGIGLEAIGPTGVSAIGNGSAGTAVDATTSGSSECLRASNSGDGRAVYAISTGSDGEAVRAESQHFAAAVLGQNDANGNAITGISNGTGGSGVSGVSGHSGEGVRGTNTSSGHAVIGVSTGSNGAGVRGESSTSAAGVHGVNNTTAGPAISATGGDVGLQISASVFGISLPVELVGDTNTPPQGAGAVGGMISATTNGAGGGVRIWFNDGGTWRKVSFT